MQCGHVSAVAEEVHGHERHGARTRRAGHGGRIETVGVGIDVGEDGSRAEVPHGLCDIGPAERRHHDLVPRTNARGGQLCCPHAGIMSTQHELPVTTHKKVVVPEQKFRDHDLHDLFGGVLLSHTLPHAVPSALKGLASGFGM